MKRNWKIVGLVAGALLMTAPQAFADLKSVFTAVCSADDDALLESAGPTTQPGKPTPAVCSFTPPDCRTLMLCMDKADWHVIHDTRYGGAWFDLRVGTPGTPLYKLIFQKD